MRFTASSLAAVACITLVSASSPSPVDDTIVARSEHNKVERDLLERAASNQKMVKINRRRDHGPRRQDTAHMKVKKGTLPIDLNLPPVAVVQGKIDIAENPNQLLNVDLDADVLPTHESPPAPAPPAPAPPAPAPAPAPQPDIPIKVNADLLGRPLANVNGAINLGLNNLGLGGLNLKERDNIPDIPLNIDLKPVAVVNGHIDLAPNPEQLLDVDLNADVLPTEHPAPSPAPPAPAPPAPAPAHAPRPDIPIKVNADLLGRPLANVNGAINLGLNNLGLGGLNLKERDNVPDIPLNVDLKPVAVVNGHIDLAPNPEQLLDVDLNADVLPTNHPAPSPAPPAPAPAPPAPAPAPRPDIPIKVNADLLGRPLANVNGAINLGLNNLGLGGINLVKKDGLPVVVDADLQGKPLADVNGVIHLDDLLKALNLDVSSIGLHKREKRDQAILAEESVNGHRQVGGLTLDTLKTRTDALSAVLAAHLADSHDDCSLDDVTAALSSLLSGIDHAVFRRKL